MLMSLATCCNMLLPSGNCQRVAPYGACMAMGLRTSNAWEIYDISFRAVNNMKLHQEDAVILDRP